MPTNLLLIRAFETVKNRFILCLDDVPPDQLAHRPHPEANSIAWLAWHLTRWQDAQVARFVGADQAWTAGWAEQFGRPNDPADTGIGHTSDQVAGLRATAELLQGYHEAVVAATTNYLKSVNEVDLQRQAEGPRGPDTIEGRLVGVLSDNFQHVGQMAYLRGLFAGVHWGAH